VRTRLAAVVLLSSSLAHAEEPKIDYADGPSACREFHAKNDRELETWQKQQPAVPYKYPQEKEVLGAPWGGVLESIGSQWELVLATIIPHFGAQLRSDSPAAIISWPLSIPIGPAYTCSRTQGSFTVKNHKAHRAMLEPGIVSSNRGVGAFLRPGYRFIYQPSDWVVGPGGGLLPLPAPLPPPAPLASPSPVP